MKYKQKYGYVYLSIAIMWIISAIILLNHLKYQSYLTVVILFFVVAALNFMQASVLLFGLNYVQIDKDKITLRHFLKKEQVILISEINSIQMKKKYLTRVLIITSKYHYMSIYNIYKMGIHKIENKIRHKIQKNDTSE